MTTLTTSLFSCVGKHLLPRLLPLALLLRIALLFYGEYQDAHFQVQYTDVDYKVYTDAANRVFHGQSPFKRYDLKTILETI